VYHPRIADLELKQRLEATGAVVVEGPRACGKTELARQIAASEVLLDIDEEARRAIAIDPGLVLAGDSPRLIDEWQIEPTIWNHVRRIVDQRQNVGQFILTGSSVPSDDITRHTGAGRISRLRLRTMSLLESGYSSGEISLGSLLEGQFLNCADPGLKVKDVVERLCAGGWPGHLDLPLKASLDAQRDYLEEIQRVDIVRVDGVRRDPYNVARVIRSLARNVATTVSARTLAADAGGAAGSLDDDTVRDYLDALRRLMIVEEQSAWSPHLRSRSILRKSPKRHFVDPSLAVASLGATPDRLLKDLNLLGFLFESLVHRDLSIYAQAMDAAVFHYRDNTNVEVDAIVETRHGDWCAFEVKLGTGQVDQAAAALLKFCDRMDLNKCGEPKTLGVIVSNGYGYMRKDGVAVIPIGALGP
jgi:predicted AAA+ superfamily ATPase